MKLRTLLLAAEVLIGLSAVAVSIYLIFDVSKCGQNAEFCKPLGMLPVLLLLVPGCLASIAGFMSYSPRRFSVWTIQLALVALIALYYGSLFAAVLVLGS